MLEGIKKVSKIDDETVINMDQLKEQFPEKFNEDGGMDWKWFENDIRPNTYIYMREDKNSISFTLQKGAIKDAGKNGCQVTALIDAARIIIEDLDNRFPCTENANTIKALHDALEWQALRTMDRERRGVEGQQEK